MSALKCDQCGYSYCESVRCPNCRAAWVKCAECEQKNALIDKQQQAHAATRQQVERALIACRALARELTASNAGGHWCKICYASAGYNEEIVHRHHCVLTWPQVVEALSAPAPAPDREAMERVKTCRIDMDEDGLDDLAVSDVSMVRIERMDTSTYWAHLCLADGREVDMAFWSRGKIKSRVDRIGEDHHAE